MELPPELVPPITRSLLFLEIVETLRPVVVLQVLVSAARALDMLELFFQSPDRSVEIGIMRHTALK
jgi:hypothetical protein